MIDNFRTDESTTRYSLESGEKETPLRPTELAAEPGDRVVVTGEMRDGRLVGEVEETVSSQASPLAGARKVAVILFTLPGDSGHSWTQEQARSRVFTASNSVSAFYEEESYGQISLTGKLRADGDVFGPFALSGSTAGCPYTTWNDEADQAAASAGVDLSGYQHIIYIFPLKSACQWGGIADLGGSRININGNSFGDAPTRTIAHEFGHNFGLQHAGSWTCTSGGVRVQISKTCTISEYGDPFDTMGNVYRHNNGWNLAKLGLFASENIETVTESGTYSLRSAFTPTTQPTVLRIPRAYAASNNNITSWYYLEIRQTGGIFENVSDASMTGVSIRATAEFNSPETLLLDANPATSSFIDAPLKVGQTFDGGPVQINTLSAGSGQASVEVQVDTEPPSPPELQANVSADGVELSWVSTDNVGVEQYFVYRDGKVVTTRSTPSFLDRWAPVGDHDYVVVARDESRNESDPSEPLTVTVPVKSGPTCSEGKCKLAYRYSGAPATWTVPPGVDSAFVNADGAGGGGIGGGPERSGGVGARVWATLEPLAPGQVAEISIGGQGKPDSEGGGGGFNAGGAGGIGGGGGGYTTFELGSTLEVLAAGGGGGGMDGANGAHLPQGGRGGAGGAQGSFFTRGANTSSQGATLRGGAGGVWGGAGGTGG
ncbi:MAG TPA: M12 family metallo-peptidase, partial [Thermoanaerobaculia bacterium]|nr:M12 family metallo-peptidase [Thermoanaerobaculia bacterium]